MTNWKNLVESADSDLTRGMLLRFAAGESFENYVVMMVCEDPDKTDRLGLITISGYKAGINCYVVFPNETESSSYQVSIRWLIDNWKIWGWPDGNVNQVEIRQPLNALEIE
jgi:hypothetical protein